jgi:hypothetical protein
VDIVTLEAQIRTAGVAFISLRPVREEQFDFELLIDYARMNVMDAYALLAAAFEAGRLGISPLRIVLAWGSGTARED